MENCIFCRIIAGKAPGEVLYKDELVCAFRDAHPAASTHVLVVPTKHIASVNEITPEDEASIGHLFTVARQIARQEGIDQNGYRLIVNTGPYAGQVVPHVHLHLIGGQRVRTSLG